MVIGGGRFYYCSNFFFLKNALFPLFQYLTPFHTYIIIPRASDCASGFCVCITFVGFYERKKKVQICKVELKKR